MMVTGPGSVNGLGLDVTVTALVTGALIAFAARLYPHVVQ